MILTTPNNNDADRRTVGAQRPPARDFTSLVPVEIPEECLFFRFTAEEASARHIFPLGEVSGIKRFTACHRYEPFWMKPRAGTSAGEVPIETQFLLVELEDGTCALFVPLLDGGFRCALQGAGENALELVAESGDPAVVTKEVIGLFVAVGDDPYTLVEESAESVAAYLGTGRRLYEKPEPDFFDYFGWCTWDAFYQEVSHDKIREGLESFQAGGITPKVVILDDGWQSVRKMESGERRLTSFAANEKFPGDLKPTIDMAKEEFEVEFFLVWHALNGYWGGVDGDALPGYGVRAMERRFSEGILHHVPTIADWWGKVMGVVPPEHIYRFFQDYHRHLRLQGVDGVKVDNQAALEGVSYGFGGRVAAMRAYHEALEGAAQVHFKGELINCMSCASEMLYSGLNSNILRTSTDFWPNRPGSHGLHLYTNAQVSLWFGEFFFTDWDMFQSGHPAGAYHAAARALSGGPVYVSDKPDAHNFDLIKKLVLPDGWVPRFPYPGRPTRDCLLHDPTQEDVLLKIFNLGLGKAMVGAFNGRYDEEKEIMVSGDVGPSDIEGLVEGERFAVYAHYAKTLRVMQREERIPVTLKPLECELFTVVPIENGIAPIGLVEMFNSAYCVNAMTANPDFTGFNLRVGGSMLVWCEKPPVRVEIEGEPIDFAYDSADSGLRFTAPMTVDMSVVKIKFA